MICPEAYQPSAEHHKSSYSWAQWVRVRPKLCLGLITVSKGAHQLIITFSKNIELILDVVKSWYFSTGSPTIAIDKSSSD